jgi:hypothetical protein
VTAVPVPDVPVAARRAVWCCEAHPFAYLVLCRLLDGHSGLHRSDDSDDWAAVPTPTEENDR